MSTHQRVLYKPYHEKISHNSEYSDLCAQKDIRIANDGNPIRRSLSVHNDKNKNKIGTTTNWMPAEIPKEIQDKRKGKQLYKQMYGTSCNWKMNARIKMNKERELLHKGPRQQPNVPFVEPQLFPDIRKTNVLYMQKKRNKNASPSKTHNKTFEASTKKMNDNIENELSFEESGIGFHITRKTTGKVAQFVDRFKDKLNLMLYDFNGFNKKKESSPPPVYLKNKSPSNNILYQNTLSCF